MKNEHPPQVAKGTAKKSHGINQTPPQPRGNRAVSLSVMLLLQAQTAECPESRIVPSKSGCPCNGSPLALDKPRLFEQVMYVVARYKKGGKVGGETRKVKKRNTNDMAFEISAFISTGLPIWVHLCPNAEYNVPHVEADVFTGQCGHGVSSRKDIVA